jgi:hypothetical protein
MRAVPRARLALTWLGIVVGAAACSGDDEPAAAPPPPPMPAYLVDAAPVEPEALATVLPSFDPASGYHLDEAGAAPARRAERSAPRERRVLQIMLKSTPSGAIAAVDGKVIGRTPVLWEGDFTGKEREFTFVLPGYAMARYRFVPIQDGFVHGRLEKVSSDLGDGGVPEIPVPRPTPPLPAPRAAPPARPRPVAPDAATPVTQPSQVTPDATPPALQGDAGV